MTDPLALPLHRRETERRSGEVLGPPSSCLTLRNPSIRTGRIGTLPILSSARATSGRGNRSCEQCAMRAVARSLPPWHPFIRYRRDSGVSRPSPRGASGDPSRIRSLRRPYAMRSRSNAVRRVRPTDDVPVRVQTRRPLPLPDGACCGYVLSASLHLRHAATRARPAAAQRLSAIPCGVCPLCAPELVSIPDQRLRPDRPRGLGARVIAFAAILTTHSGHLQWRCSTRYAQPSPGNHGNFHTCASPEASQVAERLPSGAAMPSCSGLSLAVPAAATVSGQAVRRQGITDSGSNRASQWQRVPISDQHSPPQPRGGGVRSTGSTGSPTRPNHRRSHPISQPASVGSGRRIVSGHARISR